MSETETLSLDSRLERIDKLASLAKWVLGGLIAVVIFIGSLGMKYQGFQDEMAATKERLGSIEADRNQKLQDYQQFKADIRSDVSEMKTDLKWIRSALEKR